MNYELIYVEFYVNVLYLVAIIIIGLDRTGICSPIIPMEKTEALREEVADSWSHGCEVAELD